MRSILVLVLTTLVILSVPLPSVLPSSMKMKWFVWQILIFTQVRPGSLLQRNCKILFHYQRSGLWCRIPQCSWKTSLKCKFHYYSHWRCRTGCNGICGFRILYFRTPGIKRNNLPGKCLLFSSTTIPPYCFAAKEECSPFSCCRNFPETYYKLCLFLSKSGNSIQLLMKNVQWSCIWQVLVKKSPAPYNECKAITNRSFLRSWQKG